MNKKIYLIMGEAGSGKDFLVKNLVQSNPDLFNEIISYTTRPMRSNEVDGVNYHFISVNEFLTMNMLEQTMFNGWYYGTGLNCLVDDKINLGVFNPAGVKTLTQRACLDTTVYKLETKPATRLIRQLQREEDPDIKEIFRRYEADEKDFKDLLFNYTVLRNETFVDLEKAMNIITLKAKQDLGKNG